MVMVNGRLYDAATLTEKATGSTTRAKAYFEM